MKTASNYPKSNAHAATTRVSAAEGENLAESADSQVKSPPIAADEGLVWDETTAQAFKTIRQVIWRELAKHDLCEYAEDVYQDTYLAAFHTSSKPQGNNLGAWFRGIARNVANECVRQVLSHGARGRFQSLDEGLEHGLDFVDDQDFTSSSLETEHVLRILSSAVGHQAAFERTLINAFRYDGDTAATAKFLGVPRRTVQWSQRMVRKFGVVIARALTVRTERIERGKIHDPVTVGELVWCLPSEVDSDVYLTLLVQAGSVDRISQDDIATLTGLSRPEAGRYASEITRMLSIARSVVETGNLATEEEI